MAESGCGRELVEQLPQLTRKDYRKLKLAEVWDREVSLAGEVRFLEWNAAGGLRHATLGPVTRDPAQAFEAPPPNASTHKETTMLTEEPSVCGL